MELIHNPLYMEDLQYIAGLNLPWEKLKDKSVVISGGTGLIGRCFIDTLMLLNQHGLNCTVYALGRNREKAQKMFSYCSQSDRFHFIPWDVSKPLPASEIKTADYVLHLASNTHPMQYSQDPIGTITTNIFGTYNMLEFAAAHNAIRCAVASSNEIYGENRGDTEKFNEAYCGYIDSNTLRAGYPESKRCSEALCQAYIRQRGIDIVIPRLTRSYGPTMLPTDTKAISQFIKKGLAGEDIVLKSAGTQYYSYTYAADAVAGLFTVLLQGKCGEAYNISGDKSDITLKDLANIIAHYAGKKVVFEIPDAVEAAGYSKATKARIDGRKIQQLGWTEHYDICSGLERTLKILGTEYKD